MATVQDLINQAVELIDDTAADYATGYFGSVTMVITELMRLGIGILHKEYAVTLNGSETNAYTPTATDYKPVALPTDLTTDKQIQSVRLYDEIRDIYKYTETHSGTFYLLVPVSYVGEIIVKYTPNPVTFTSLAETLPINDDAAFTVAPWGLAKLLSISNATEYTDMLTAEYERAKSKWKPRDYNKQRRVNATYNMDWGV